MGDIPVDARRVVDELRSSRRSATATAPRVWMPSESFESALGQANRTPVHLNEHLGWMHENWDMRSLLSPPPLKGWRGLVRRLVHRAVMAVFGPFFHRLQDYAGVNLRAVDAVARRTNEVTISQQRLIGALRADMIDFARHVDERLSE